MNKIYVLPTGNEILDGTVLDLDAPEIIKTLVKLFPQVEITRLCPLVDDEDGIVAKIDELVKNGADMLVLIGGSGGGHRFSDTLGKDYTHSALERYLDKNSFREIYGKNGHLWCKLVCGKKGNCLIINTPGPYVETAAAIKAFAEVYKDGVELDEINQHMAEAVFAQYPKGAATL